MLVAASQQFKLAELCLTQQHQNATPAAARRPPPTMSPPPAQVFVSSAVAPQHELPGHFERPARVSVVLQSLKDANLVASAFPGQVCSYRRRADTTHVPISGNVDRLVKIVRLLPALLPAAQIHDVPAAKAPMEAVRRMHTYAEALEQRAAAHHAAGGEGVAPLEVADLGDPEGVTYMTPTTFHDALVASGAAIAVERKSAPPAAPAALKLALLPARDRAEV